MTPGIISGKSTKMKGDSKSRKRKLEQKLSCTDTEGKGNLTHYYVDPYIHRNHQRTDQED